MLLWIKKGHIIKLKNLPSYVKMGQEMLSFGNIEVWEKKYFTAIRLLFFKRMEILRKY